MLKNMAQTLDRIAIYISDRQNVVSRNCVSWLYYTSCSLHVKRFRCLRESCYSKLLRTQTIRWVSFRFVALTEPNAYNGARSMPRMIIGEVRVRKNKNTLFDCRHGAAVNFVFERFDRDRQPWSPRVFTNTDPTSMTIVIIRWPSYMRFFMDDRHGPANRRRPVNLRVLSSCPRAAPLTHRLAARSVSPMEFHNSSTCRSDAFLSGLFFGGRAFAFEFFSLKIQYFHHRVPTDSALALSTHLRPRFKKKKSVSPSYFLEEKTDENQKENVLSTLSADRQ